jgi:excisionase family DNA binding protein
MTRTRSQIVRASTTRRTSIPRTPHRGGHREPPVELLTVEQTAAWLGVSRSTIYRMLKTGRLPLTEFAIGNEMRLSRRQLIAWLEQTLGAPTTDLQRDH